MLICLLVSENPAGQEKLSAIRSGGGFLVLVYSVVDSSSFDLIRRILKQIPLNDRNKFPMLMVANKADLIDDHQVYIFYYSFSLEIYYSLI